MVLSSAGTVGDTDFLEQTKQLHALYNTPVTPSSHYSCNVTVISDGIKPLPIWNYFHSLGVFEVLSGVFPGVFEEPVKFRKLFSPRTELFIGFIGVFNDPEELWLSEQLIAESLFDKFKLSVILRCQRICGPLVNGASILITLLTSFSNPKRLISAKAHTQTVQSVSKSLFIHATIFTGQEDFVICLAHQHKLLSKKHYMQSNGFSFSH